MGRPLRIGIDVRHIRDYGIGSYIRNLLLALAQRADPHEYLLAGRPQDLRDLPALPERFRKAQFPRSDHGLLNQVTFPLFLSRFPLDLTHIPLNSVPLAMPRPYVVTVHDMSSLLFPVEGEGWARLRQSYRRLRFRRGLLRANRVLAVSQATQTDVETVLGIPPERIRLIYGAVDPKFLQPLHPADARSAGPNSTDYYRRQFFERYQIHHPYLLYAGTIRPQKNVPRLIEAFSVLKGQLAGHPFYAPLKLLIIGDEVSRHPQVRRAVVQTRMEREVRFFGFVSFDTLRLLYEGAEVFVFPSLYEGFGLPPLEAMASGVPVVTSNTSSLPEVVGDAAELVNPENVFDIVRGIRQVLINADYRQELIERGRRRAHLFNWAETARQVVEVYQEVAAEQPRTR